MNKITRNSNWCEIDQLDGKDLVDGEMLFIRFPDGHASGHTIKVKQETYDISDHGHNYGASRNIGFAPIDYHGVVVLVPLVGLEARRV